MVQAQASETDSQLLADEESQSGLRMLETQVLRLNRDLDETHDEWSHQQQLLESARRELEDLNDSSQGPYAAQYTVLKNNIEGLQATVGELEVALKQESEECLRATMELQPLAVRLEQLDAEGDGSDGQLQSLREQCQQLENEVEVGSLQWALCLTRLATQGTVILKNLCRS